MKALKIIITKQPRYYRWEQDREYFHAGETVSGRVEFDESWKKPPAGTRVVWTDSYDRLVRSTPGKWNARRGYLEFEFKLDGLVSQCNYLEVAIRGARQARQRFFVVRPFGPWDDYHVISWGRYPYGYYEELREMGVDAIMAYKRTDFQHVIENDFLAYVSQVCPDEVALYHRPYSQYWEAPAKPTHPGRRQSFFLLHWDMIRQRYKRARARLKGLSVALDPEGVKTLWRAGCPSDRGVQAKMRERIINTVVQHKVIRPVFYDLADEPGTGDQAAPFDFCYCKHCMDRFRGWLEKRYSTLGGLNREWDTDFHLWREVVPLTTDDTMRAHARKDDFNFSSWADHREFMDTVMADSYARMREYAREADPHGIYGLSGVQLPYAYGGWDYAKLAKATDVFELYNIGGNDDLMRSFTQHGARKVMCYFGRDPRLPRRMWYQLFHGDSGQVHWDNDEPDGRMLERPSHKPARRTKVVVPTFRELTRGAGKQIMSMQPAGEGLAVHHSQASMRAHWMLGALGEGEDWVNRDSQEACDGYRDRMYALRLSTTRLPADCGLQFRMVAYDQMAEGELERGAFRAVLLPQSLALGDDECRRLRSFAENGGVVVADALAGLMNESCKMLPAGQLDDLFGVKRGKFTYEKLGARIKVTRSDVLPGLTRGRLALRAVEPTLKATRGATACAKAGGADCLVVRKVGRGLAIYLNADLSGYSYWRYDLGSALERDSQTLLSACMLAAGLEPQVTLLTGQPARWVPGAIVRRFVDGPVEMVGAVVNEKRRTGGLGEERTYDLDSFDKSCNMTVRLPRRAHVYDSRTGEYHGLTASFRDRWNHLDAKLWALLPYEVTGLSARATGTPRAGADARVRIAFAVKGGPAGRHVIRCDVYDPRGKWCSHYSKNLVTDAGRGELRIPLAESDPAGTWRIELRDVVSGRKASARMKVRAARRRR